MKLQFSWVAGAYAWSTRPSPLFLPHAMVPWPRATAGQWRGWKGNIHAPGRPRIRSKPWALPLLLRAGTSSPQKPTAPHTCSMTWGKPSAPLRAATSPTKAGMATCTYFTGCWYSGLEPTSGAVSCRFVLNVTGRRQSSLGLARHWSSVNLCFSSTAPDGTLGGPEDTPRGSLW